MKDLQSPIPNPQSIDLHIEELVLHGFNSDDRYALGTAVERELARLFTEQGIPATFAQEAQIQNLGGGSFTASAGGEAETMGAQIAQVVHGSLNR